MVETRNSLPEGKEPEISVIVPIYQTERYLDRCIESIVNQTYSNLEIILVDDGSPDRCPQMCDEWAKKDSRIRVVHKQNAGLGMARNSGIEAATGEYICFFDSDDYVALDTIEKAYRLAEAEQSDVIVFGLNNVNAQGRVIRSVIPESDRVTYAGEDVQKRFLPDLIAAKQDSTCRNVWMSAWACILSMRMIRKTGWRFVSEREIISEDVYSLLCLYAYVKRVSVLPEALYYYCENGASLTHVYKADRFEKICHFYETSVRKALELGYDEEVAERLQWQLACFVIAAMKQVVRADIPNKDRYRAIREIVHSDYLNKICWDLTSYSDSLPRRVFLFLMEKRWTLPCYLILKSWHK